MEVQRGDEGDRERACEALRAWMASGKQLQAYCEETGEPYWPLRRWRLKYGEALGIDIRRRPGASKVHAMKAAAKSRSTLVPIRIAGAAPRASVATVEIRLRGERTLVVMANVESATLTRLVIAIEGAS